MKEFRTNDEELTLEGIELLLRDEEAGIKEFDPADYVGDSESVAAYLNAMLETGDESLLAEALGVVARAAGMATVAEKAAVGRESLYKSLRRGASPRLATINRVVKALGMKLVIEQVTDPVFAQNELATLQKNMIALMEELQALSDDYKYADEVVPVFQPQH